MDILNANDYKLSNLSKINIILGKNGCGKSSLLRLVESALISQPQLYGKVKYITPERGGSLVYEAGMEQSLLADSEWLRGQRRSNQARGFREQSVVQYKLLENLVLREIEKEKRTNLEYTFDIYVEKVNLLLDNIEIKRNRNTFDIFIKNTENKIQPQNISSGESELISLGIECLIFSKECIDQKENILFLDEPDVHLHPDLQYRLMNFLKQLVLENNFRIIISTHSTAILGALESYADTNIEFMKTGQKELLFKSISEVYRKILPVFGAHPLSNVFNEAPIFLVEGEDDERIWQQVVRSSRGEIKIYPCVVESVDSLHDFEVEAQKILQTVYENAKGFSLRDRDGVEGEIEDMMPIIRMRLSCRNSENLLLTNEVLNLIDIDWEALKTKIDEWLTKNPEHPHFRVMNAFKEAGYDRKNYDIKEARNDLMYIMGSSKPWECVVGKAIAAQKWSEGTNYSEEGSIKAFLGKKLVELILPKA
jgi:predicted ATPase